MVHGHGPVPNEAGPVFVAPWLERGAAVLGVRDGGEETVALEGFSVLSKRGKKISLNIEERCSACVPNRWAWIFPLC